MNEGELKHGKLIEIARDFEGSERESRVQTRKLHVFRSQFSYQKSNMSLPHHAGIGNKDLGLSQVKDVCRVLI